jgi:hypothetical protein
LGFGDYCEVYDGADNATKSRSLPSVALYPRCNITGSWAFYSLTSKTRIHLLQWKRMVTSAEFTEKMSALDPDAVALEPVGEAEQQVSQQELQAAEDTGVGEVREVDEDPATQPSENPVSSSDTANEEGGNDNEMLGFINQEDEDSDNDGKSHSGIVIFVSGVVIFCASGKQTYVCKSPTEAELVALSDNLGFIELFQEFITFVTNAAVEVPLIFQDNTLVISMVTTGGGINTTKHMRTRMFLVLESLKEKPVTICYIHTSGIIADGLTRF